MSVTTTAERVYNFSAGPAVLPLAVLKRIQEELLVLPGCGASILEISHRGTPFLEILEQATQRLRRLLSISDDYEVLFLQGGSRLQFSMVPANLLRGSDVAAEYVLTGSWGQKAMAEAQKEGPVHVAWDGKSTRYDRLPAAGALQIDDQAPFVHLTSNETIQGVQFHDEPGTAGVPIVCDASSDFLSRPLELERYGLIYACAQKNAGPAGVTLVIIRKDWLDRGQDTLPGYMNYRLHAEESSLYATPNTFGIYVFGLVAQWLLDEVGGLAAMHRQNQEKADLLYSVIDESPDFYVGHARPDSRSLMNVTFCLADDRLQSDFIKQAADKQLAALTGHRSVGGIRASIYNAMPVAGVAALRDFMIDFRGRQG